MVAVASVEIKRIAEYGGLGTKEIGKKSKTEFSFLLLQMLDFVIFAGE